MNTIPGEKLNRLAGEKSPYLRQHAANPVDWQPWGPEAFARAERENKPIFLSIGYATCHWCHVMAHESFEDPEVARLMNAAFVCIKVDREERPDIDQAYLAACQMLTGRGGWPLTILLTPEKKPFFVATYLPRQSRFGNIGLLELIPRIQEMWQTRRAATLASAEQITRSLGGPADPQPAEELNESALDQAYGQLSERFDELQGGFGEAPKFPAAPNLLFLLRYWKRTGNQRARRMVEQTLLAMRRGGIFDQLGFGFHRYATDRAWRAPHFEKMLYDQALLSMACTETAQVTGEKQFAQTAREICAYVLRDLTAPAGGFYSAEDADSEGQEGLFYLWTRDQIRAVLDKKEAELAVKIYGLKPEGNFPEESANRPAGANILHQATPLEQIAFELKMTAADLRQRAETIRQKLFLARCQRVRPDKDDKILTDWNGLMIAALAKAAHAFDEPEYIAAAAAAADFILEHLRRSDGRLLHRFRDGAAAINAFLDDYAFLIWGLIELYEAAFETRYLQSALELNDQLLVHCWDRENGGFFFTANDAEPLPTRRKEGYDSALPAGNAVAMLNMLRLGRLSGNLELERKAWASGRAFSAEARRAPAGHAFLMAALDFALGPGGEVVVAGDSRQSGVKAMLRALGKEFIPNTVVLLRRNEQQPPDILKIAGFAREQKGLADKATAYVCTRQACRAPTTDIAVMLDQIGVGKNSSAFNAQNISDLPGNCPVLE